MFRHSNGFTLIEVMIVGTIVVIMGLTVLIGINPLAQMFKGFDTRRRDDLNKIKIAFEAYYSDKGCYPPQTVLNQCGSDILNPYLQSIPCDPNDSTPYKIKLVPSDSSCPQEYAVYTSLYSFFSRITNPIPDCPKTFAVYSSNMSQVDIINGCSGKQYCSTYYGCVNSSCTIVSVDSKPTCSPNYCDSDCGGVNCAQKDRRGRLINSCVSL